jgi:hypothetical protein
MAKNITPGYDVVDATLDPIRQQQISDLLNDYQKNPKNRQIEFNTDVTTCIATEDIKWARPVEPTGGVTLRFPQHGTTLVKPAVEPHRWGIPLGFAEPNKGVKVVWSGQVVAYVTRVHDHHTKVTFIPELNKLFTSAHGPADLLYLPPDIDPENPEEQLAIINIGPYVPLTGVAKLPVECPASNEILGKTYLGKVTNCPVHTLGNEELGTHHLVESERLITLYNVRKTRVPSGFVQFKWADGKYVIDDNDIKIRLVQFISTSKMDMGTIEGLIVDTEFLGYEELLETEIVAHDKNNQWPQAQKWATGIAMLNDFNQWIIIALTLPVNELVGTLDNCMLHNHTIGVLTLDSESWKQSDYPFVDPPPELIEESEVTYNWTGTEWTTSDTCPGNIVYIPKIPPLPGQPTTKDVVCLEYLTTLAFENRYQLDGVADSYVRVKRITFGNTTVPNGTYQEPPKIGEWVVEYVKDSLARWVRASKDGEIINWYEGADPRPCNPTVGVAFPNFCMRSNDTMICFYAPEIHTYIGISTASAMMGTPSIVDNVTGVSLSGCLMTVTSQQHYTHTCELPPESITFSIAPQAVNVVTGVTLDENGLCYTQGTIAVCGSQVGAYQCIDTIDCTSTSQTTLRLPTTKKISLFRKLLSWF